jgi:autotransporter-associated beta strand protein
LTQRNAARLSTVVAAGCFIIDPKIAAMKRPPHFHSTVRILTCSIATLILGSEYAGAAAWVGNIDGNWSDPTRWSGPVPNSIDEVADFSGADITANRTVTVDGNFTVGTLRFGDAVTATNDWFLTVPSGNTTNALTLNVSSGVPVLEVVSRNATISTLLAGSKGLNKTGAGVAFLTRENTFTGDTVVSAGALIMGNGGSSGSIQSTRVVNSIGAGANAPGGFEIRRSDAYTVPFDVVNPANNQGAGSFTINGSSFAVPTSGITLNHRVRQSTLHVGRIGLFGRTFIETGADIGVSFFFLGEQSGRTGQGIQNGGDVTITDRMQIGHWPQADPVTGAANTTTPSTYTINGGTLKVTATFTGNPQTAAAPEKPGSIYLGVDSTGELIVNGGTIETKAIVLDNRGATNGTDHLAINGGLVRVGGAGAGTDADLANIGSAIISNNTSSTYAVNYTGGTLQAVGNFLHAVDATLESTNGNITFDTNGNLVTVTGILSGAGGLRKTGAGTLLIKSANSFSGNTTVDGGVVSMVGSVTSPVIVNSGGIASGSGDGVSGGLFADLTVNAGGGVAPGTFATAGSIGTLRATTLSLSGDARFDLNPTSTTVGSDVNDLVAVSGALTFNAGSTITPVFSSLPTAGNTYTLFTSGSRTGVPALSSQAASRLTFSLDTTTQPNNVLLSVTGSGASLSLTWKGGGATNNWDVNTTANWNNNTEKFFQLDRATFDDTGSNAAPVNLVGLLQAGAITVTGAKDYTFDGPGVLSGPSGLTKSGTGVLSIVGGNHDFAGPVTINGGTVVVTALRRAGQPSSLGSGNALTLESTILRYTGPTTSTDRTITLNGTGALLDITDAAAAVSITTPVDGPGKFSKSGPGRLVLPAANSYAGGTDILAGSVQITSIDRPLGDGFEVKLDNGAVFDVNGISGATATRRYDLVVGAGGATISNPGAGVINSPIYRSITLQGNLTMNVTGRYDLNGGAVDGAGVTFTGDLFSLTKEGPGETWWAPNGGATVGNIIVNAGTFGVQASGVLGSEAHTITVNPLGQLFTFSAVSNSKPIVLNGGLLAANNSTGTWFGTVTLAGPGTTNRIGIINTGVGVTLGGQVTGPGGFQLVNGGVVELQNLGNDWQGDTLLSAGTLLASSDGALSPATHVTLNGGSLNLTFTTQTIAGLAGSVGSILGSGVLTVNQSTNTTFNGTLAETTSLTKTGTGTLTLTATNSTTGTTRVNGGALLVNGTLAGNVVVDAGTLGGFGSIGPVALNAGGTLAPGSGPGVLDSFDATFNGGTFALELNGTTADVNYDQLNVTGAVNLLVNSPLTITLGFDPADFVDSFVIVNNDGSDAVTRTGTFTFNGQPLAEGAQFGVGAQVFRISYTGGTNNNDIVLTAIPEPTALAALLAGSAAILGCGRARRGRVPSARRARVTGAA